MSEDTLRYLAEDRSAPASDAFAVAKSDGADLPYVSKSLLIDAAGVLRVTMKNQKPGEFIDLPVIAGYNPLRVTRVWATGSTAGNVFALL